MITIEDLLASGFRKHSCGKPSVKTLYQKCVRDPSTNAKLYFINVHEWNFEGLTATRDRGLRTLELLQAANRFSVECRMYTDDTVMGSFDLNFILDGNWTVEKLLSSYEKAYIRMRCVPDKHNND